MSSQEIELEADYRNLETEKTNTINEKIALDKKIRWYTIFGWSLITIGGASFLIPIIPLFPTVVPLNEYGDFIGGVVSSIWSLAGLIFIYVAFLGQRQQLIIQQFELKYTQFETKATRLEIQGQREQMRIQNETLSLQRFENTFFQLLQTHNQIVHGIDLKNKENIIVASGKDCFKNFYIQCFHMYIPSKQTLIEQRREQRRTGPIPEDELRTKYEELYKKREGDLGHYFRSFFYLIQFVDDAPTVIENKRKYTDILRANLSSYELVFIFFMEFLPMVKSLLNHSSKNTQSYIFLIKDFFLIKKLKNSMRSGHIVNNS